jgi:ankyrin repeat protein
MYILSPLHVAAEAGNTLLCKFILERSEDKNPIVDEWRFDFELDVEWNPLLAAARYGQLDTCLAIMDSLGAINPGNAQGLTPLHAAAPGGHFQICNAILEQLGNPSSYIFEPRGQLQSHATSMCGRERSRQNI